MINAFEITPINVFLAWTASVSLTLFLYTLFKFKKQDKINKNQKSEAEKRWNELEKKAQYDYQVIISTANKKAAEIISLATNINQNSANTIENSINAMLQNQKQNLELNSTEISKRNQKEVTELNNKIITLLTNVYKDIETSTKADLENYKAVIKKQTFDAEKISQEKLQIEYKKLEQEIEQRKIERYKEIEDNIYKILSKVSKDIIGKSLDVSQHEDLIIKTLDKAKKEGVL